MKMIIPQNDVVLCTCITSNEQTTESGFVYKVDAVPLYRVVLVGPNVLNNLSLEEGDIIRTNSTGTCIHVDGVEYFMFKIENVAGKVV